MAKQTGQTGSGGRRMFTAEFKKEAVQMTLDGHSTASIAKNLGKKNANVLYRWKAEALSLGGPAAQVLDSQVSELRDELVRTRRERDILKKALAIFSQQE
ncbi:MAG: transposase [Planctomycetota bacterium]|nr:transposase [Planctomycetota bacterium]